MRQRRQRIEQMVRNDALGLANRGQVVRAVPLVEQRDVREELRLRGRIDVEAERGDASGERLSEHHAVSFSWPGSASLNPRLRCTSNNEIAAGVMPEMRAACPSVSG